METIRAYGYDWSVTYAKDWDVSTDVMRLLVARPQERNPRRPTQFALAQSSPFSKVSVECDIRPAGNSMIVVYAWQSPSKFNYAHLSTDAAKSVEVHNGIFHVFGGDRVRISPLDGPPSFTKADWHSVKLDFDGESGRVDVRVDGKTNPSLSAIDWSLRSGRAGLGSFFEKGDFRSVVIRPL